MSKEIKNFKQPLPPGHYFATPGSEAAKQLHDWQLKAMMKMHEEHMAKKAKCLKRKKK